MNVFASKILKLESRVTFNYRRWLSSPQTMKVCCGLVNRGFAVYHDRLFMVTLDAHFEHVGGLRVGARLEDLLP